jgi:hypothetical protein
MAKPIKETPILTGKDAAKFRKTMQENKNKVVSTEVKQRIKANYESLKAIADFAL